MAGGIMINGSIRRAPGIPGRIDASALNALTPEVGVIAVLADLDFLPQAAPVVATSRAGLVAQAPDDREVRLLGRLLYEAARDAKVQGSPGAVVLVSPTATTQAQATLMDDDGAPSVVVRSRAWGPRGNKLWVRAVEGQTNPDALDVTLARPGMPTETFASVGYLPVMDVWYDGGHPSTMDVTLEVTGGTLTVRQTVDVPSTPGQVSNDSLAFDGAITFTPLELTSNTDDVILGVTVTGTRKATGTVGSETLTWINGDMAPKTTVHAYTDATLTVTNEPIEGGGGAYTDPIRMEWNAFALVKADYLTAQAAADRINAFTHRGYHADLRTARAAAIPLDELDELAVGSIVDEPQEGPAFARTVTAHLWAFVADLAGSSLAEVSRASSAAARPAEVSLVYCAGGTRTTPNGTAWDAAFTALRTRDVNIIVPLSGDATVHAKASAHCKYMAGDGELECQAWVGAATNETLAQLGTRARNLDAFLVWGIVGQEAQVDHPDGDLVWIDPAHLALMLAGIQASTPGGTPLTRKRPNVLDVRNHSSWDAFRDREAVIKAGLIAVERHPRGLRVLRSVTTHLQDDNPVLVEGSSVESACLAIRALRARLDVRIGDPAIAGTATRIKATALSVLEEMVLDGTIKAYDKASVDVIDKGDRFDLVVAVAVTEPINFIPITLGIVRIAQAA